MAKLEIDKSTRYKPIGYDPAQEKYIYFDEIITGKEKIIDLNSLTEAEKKKLIIERHKAGPDYTVQAISGPPLSRDDVVESIERDQDFGLITVQSEISYLETFLDEIRQNLK